MRDMSQSRIALWEQGGYKELKLTFTDGTVIDNSDIALESMELTETLSDESTLTYGKCSAKQFKVRIYGSEVSYNNKKFTATLTLNNDVISLGKFTVVSEEKSSDRMYTTLCAYDDMYTIINSEASTWYNSLFPTDSTRKTIKQIRDSFFSYLNLTQNEITLPQDSLKLSKTINPSTLSAIDVIQAICEINGCFGQFDYDGNFKYVFLSSTAESISKSDYKLNGLSYDDAVVSAFTRVDIKQSAEDVGVRYPVNGATTNVYTITNNFLLYGANDSQLTSVATMFYNQNKNISYTSATLNAFAKVYLEPGDFVSVDTDNGTIFFPILKRTMSGITALSDVYEAKGSAFTTTNNSLATQIEQLKGKTNIISRTTDSNTASISELSTKVDTKADGSRVTTIENNYSTLSQDLSGFKTEVGSTYQTKSDMANYSTTTQMNSAITQKASEITSTVSSTYETKTDSANNIQNAVNGIEIGGRNLFLQTMNPVFKSPWTAWGLNYGLPYLLGTDDVEGYKYYHGTGNKNVLETSEHGVKVSVGDGGSYACYYMGGYDTTHNSGMLCFEKGETYTVSFDYETKAYSGYSGSDEMYVTFTVYGNSTSASGSNFINKHFGVYEQGEYGTVKSGRCEYTFTIPNSDTLTFILLRFRFTHSTSGYNLADDYIDIKNMKLEKGNKATDWSPAPEDIENTFETHQSSINQTADKIAMVVSDSSTSSSLVLTDNALEVIADKIDLKGKVSFECFDDTVTEELDDLYDSYGSSATAKSEAIASASSDATAKVKVVTDNIYVKGTTTINGGKIDTNTLTAKKVLVTDTDSSVVFKADGTGSNHDVQIGGFTVDKESINKEITETSDGATTTYSIEIKDGIKVTETSSGSGADISSSAELKRGELTLFDGDDSGYASDYASLTKEKLFISQLQSMIEQASALIEPGHLRIKGLNSLEQTDINKGKITTSSISLDGTSVFIGSGDTVSIQGIYCGGGLSSSQTEVLFTIPFNRYINATNVTCSSMDIIVRHSSGGYPYARSGTNGATYTVMGSAWHSVVASGTNNSEVKTLTLTVVPNVGITVSIKYNYALAKASGTATAVTNNVPLSICVKGSFTFS